MSIYTKSLLVAAAVLANSVAVSAAWAEKTEVDAVIVSHNHGEIKGRTREGPITIVFSGATEIREKKGLSRKPKDAKSLIPGLIIHVEGDRQGDKVDAKEISYNEKDWRSAVATKAGTTEEMEKHAELLAKNAELSRQNAANISMLKQAMIDGQEYIIRDEVAVYFPTGKATIAPAHQTQLRALAAKAHTFGNYRISILGFADPRGNAAANERLSARRAEAVSNFLRQTGSIEPGRVLAPSAMGEGTAAPGETAPTSDAEARRVVVRVVTSKAQLTQ